MNKKIEKLIRMFKTEHNVELVYTKLETFSFAHKKPVVTHTMEKVYRYEMPEDITSLDTEEGIIAIFTKKLAELREAKISNSIPLKLTNDMHKAI